jgi:hypothetical protein
VEFLDLADDVLCGVSRSPLEWGSKAALLVARTVQPCIPSQSTSMSKPYYRIILIVLTVACGVCALVTAPIALLTAAMAFDAPDSDYQTVGVDRVLRDPVDPAVVRHRCCCWMGFLPSGLAANVTGARCNAARRRDARLAASTGHLRGAVSGAGPSVSASWPGRIGKGRRFGTLRFTCTWPSEIRSLPVRLSQLTSGHLWGSQATLPAWISSRPSAPDERVRGCRGGCAGYSVRHQQRGARLGLDAARAPQRAGCANSDKRSFAS